MWKVVFFVPIVSAVVPLEEILMQIIPPNAVELSANNRVIEKSFVDEFLETINATIADRLRVQPAIDESNDAFTPQLEESSSVSETTPFGTLRLGELYSSGYESQTFRVQNQSDLLITYYANCDVRNTLPIHPLLVASWAEVESSYLRIIFVSPPALLPLDRPIKLTHVSMPKSEWYECMSRNGVVRYMIAKRRESQQESM